MNLKPAPALAAIALLLALPCPAASHKKPVARPGLPPGIALEIDTGSVDRSHWQQAVLRLKLVNRSKQTVNLYVETLPAGLTPVFLDAQGIEQTCELGPMSFEMLHGVPIDIVPGSEQSMDLPLADYICPGGVPGGSGIDKAVDIKARLHLGVGSWIDSDTGYDATVDSVPVPVTGKRPRGFWILGVMQRSADDWNHGDLDAFATAYKNSPDILFIGHKTSRGYQQMLDSYKAAYPTPEKMGKLTFTDLEAQPLDESFATVTGNFHLERTTAGGGNADGYFLLVVENTTHGWKIVRDDSTALPPPVAATAH